MRRADRLLRLVHYLRRMRHAVTARKIAEDFGVCKRTVYRDIQDLASTGVPIVGEAGVGYLLDKKYHLPPLMFDTDELEAVALGIAMVRSWTDEGFAGKADSALEKIQAVVPAPLLRELEQLSTASAPKLRPLPWEVSFSTLRECIRHRRKIAFTYLDLRERSSRRTVRPLALVFFGPVWLLTAWCEKRGDFRNFRLDRMSGMDITGAVFDEEKDKSLRALYSRYE